MLSLFLMNADVQAVHRYATIPHELQRASVSSERPRQLHAAVRHRAGLQCLQWAPVLPLQPALLLCLPVLISSFITFSVRTTV